MPPNVREHLRLIEGQTIPTLDGSPNRIVELTPDHVVVETRTSAPGTRVTLRWLQGEVDRLWEQGGEARITTSGRGALVGAILMSMGFEVLPAPKRVIVPREEVRRIAWKSRKSAWLRDELLLALDLYLREGRNAERRSVEQLSQLLRRVPIEQELARDPQFRSEASVRLKLANFAAVDPGSGIAGLDRVGNADRDVWEEFGAHPARVASIASAIRLEIEANEGRDLSNEDEPEMLPAPEGRLLTRVHRIRERDGRLVERKKQQVMSRHGRLACECCGFDFEETYGVRGAGFIECHHIVPLSEVGAGHVTRPDDLALICANCHRMVHRQRPWLSVPELRELISGQGGDH